MRAMFYALALENCKISLHATKLSVILDGNIVCGFRYLDEKIRMSMSFLSYSCGIPFYQQPNSLRHHGKQSCHRQYL